MQLPSVVQSTGFKNITDLQIYSYSGRFTTWGNKSKLSERGGSRAHTWIIRSKFIQLRTESESRAWSRWSTNNKSSPISGKEVSSFLNRNPDRMSATTGHWRCLTKRRTAHISSSEWIAPISRIPLLVPLIRFRISDICPQPSSYVWALCTLIYLVNGSVLDIQKSNPFKQLVIHLLGLFSSGSLKGQLIWTGPHDDEVAQCTAESSVVSTILAEIWSVAAGRLKKNLTKEPKWFTWKTNSKMSN